MSENPSIDWENEIGKLNFGGKDEEPELSREEIDPIDPQQELLAMMSNAGEINMHIQGFASGWLRDLEQVFDRHELEPSSENLQNVWIQLELTLQLAEGLIYPNDEVAEQNNTSAENQRQYIAVIKACHHYVRDIVRRLPAQAERENAVNYDLLLELLNDSDENELQPKEWDFELTQSDMGELDVSGIVQLELRDMGLADERLLHILIENLSEIKARIHSFIQLTNPETAPMMLEAYDTLVQLTRKLIAMDVGLSLNEKKAIVTYCLNQLDKIVYLLDMQEMNDPGSTLYESFDEDSPYHLTENELFLDEDSLAGSLEVYGVRMLDRFETNEYAIEVSRPMLTEMVELAQRHETQPVTYDELTTLRQRLIDLEHELVDLQKAPNNPVPLDSRLRVMGILWQTLNNLAVGVLPREDYKKLFPDE